MNCDLRDQSWQIKRERKRVADNKQQQLTIWGRANSVNVQKVLWCLGELDLAYERIDAGMAIPRIAQVSHSARCTVKNIRL